MEIRRETTITALTTDNKPMEVGQSYIFNSCGRCFAGTFLGISKRGSLMFKGVIAGHEVEFNVMPRSVDSIYLSDVKVGAASD